MPRCWPTSLRAQGEFSVDLAGCRIPLGDLAHGEVAGRFTIHSLEVGPGPLVRQFAVFSGRETPAKLRPESTVLFRMVGGRVYHQGLELIFPEFSVRTYGSVGLDQTMNLMAEMPVPPKWLANRPMLAADLPQPDHPRAHRRHAQPATARSEGDGGPQPPISGKGGGKYDPRRVQQTVGAVVRAEEVSRIVVSGY